MSSVQTNEPLDQTAAQHAAGGVPAASDRWDELRSFLTSLLKLQCGLVGAVGGVVYLRPPPDPRGGRSAPTPALAATFAADARPETEVRRLLAPDGPLLPRLERLGAETLATGNNGQPAPRGRAEPIALPKDGIYDAGPTHVALAFPLTAEGTVEGACILLVPSAQWYGPPARRDTDEHDAFQRLALTCARFETFLWRERCLSEAGNTTRLRETLELLDSALQGSTAESMATLICDELQRRFGCSRVSIGLIRRDRVRLAAVSGADTLDRKGAAAEAIEAAMEECADQDVEILFPAPPQSEADPAQRRVTHAHETLSRRFGPASIVSLPLRVEGDLAGVVLMERDPDDPFPPGAIPLLRLVAEFIGPAVWTRRLADRGVCAVTRDRTLDLAAAIAGPRHTGKKLIGGLVLLTLLVMSIPWMPHRVTGEASIKAAESRTIVAPFSGHLASVQHRAGDFVAAGDALATMDTQDLDQQYAELRAQLQQLQTRRDAIARQGDAAQVALLEAQIEEISARLTLTRIHAGRAVIRAPFDGQVGRGDLETLVDAPVNASEGLFELIRDKQLVIIEIDERDIHLVRAGQRGRLVLTALPGKGVPVVVRRINPVAEAVEGGNVYRVEAEVTEPPSGFQVKPGMSGTVKLDVVDEDSGRQRRVSGLGSILGPVVDELRLRLWW